MEGGLGALVPFEIGQSGEDLLEGERKAMGLSKERPCRI